MLWEPAGVFGSGRALSQGDRQRACICEGDQWTVLRSVEARAFVSRLTGCDGVVGCMFVGG